MIGKLTGKPTIDTTDTAIVDVGGVGYEVYISPSTKSKLTGSTCEIYTHTNVRDDAIELYGFISKKELDLFRLLISVSGVGPKIALKIVDFGTSHIISAVINADVSFFSQIPKVGKKSAQRIIIDLKSKMGSLEELDLTSEDTETSDILQTLTAMGFTRDDAVSVLKKIPDGMHTIEEKIRFALKEMGKNNKQ